MGEPADHRRCKIAKMFPTYYYESDPMTVEEFKTFDIKDLPLPP
jgi:hypothetical protein